MTALNRITTVTAPAVSRDLIALADLREQLQIKATDTAQDVWLQKVITRTSRQTESYCNRIFAVQTYQDLFGVLYCEPEIPLILAQAPATVASVFVDGTALVAGTDYVVNVDVALVYRATDPRRWESTQSIAVSYSAGYSLIPDDVQKAVLEMCVMEYRGRTRDPMLRERETPGLGREMYWVGPVPGQSLPGDIGPLLQRYIRV